MDGERVLTYSALRDLYECPKRYKLKHMMAMFPIKEQEESQPMYKGSLFHEYMECGQPCAHSPCLDIRERLGDTPESLHSLATIRGVARAYEDYYSNIGAVVWPDGDREYKFSVPILDSSGNPVEGFEYAGKVDAVTQDNFWEDKTTRTIRFDYHIRLPLDMQTLLYSFVLNKTVNVYNVVRIPLLKWDNLKLTLDEFEDRVYNNIMGSLDKSFCRVEHHLPVWRVEKMGRYLFESAVTIRRLDEVKWADTPCNLYSCFNTYGHCQYVPLCSSKDEQFGLDTFYHQRWDKVNRELQERKGVDE